MAPLIKVAGADRTADLLDQLRNDEATRPASPELERALQNATAQALTTCGDEAAYNDTLIRLLRDRIHLVTTDFNIAHRNTWFSRAWARVKAKLWTLLRYQHDHMSGQQNDINFALNSALEFEHRRRIQEIKTLEARIAALEQRLNEQ